MLALSKLIANPIKIPASYFVELDKLILKCIRGLTVDRLSFKQ